jgi:hypothetical protein
MRAGIALRARAPPDGYGYLEAGGRICLQNGVVDFVCLTRSLAHDRVLRMAGEASIVRTDIAARGEAAAAQKNGERRYDEEPLHSRYP